MRLSLLLTSFGLYFQIAKGALSCKDELGKDVDWYITYKLPKITRQNPHINDGVAYAYIGPNELEWKLSEQSINSNTSAIGATLDPIYQHTPQTNFYILYNDENPYGPVSFTDGHAKGVVAFDEESGFWLIHSVPKFPPHLNESYSYPKSGQVYGQSALCISLDITQATSISNILYLDDPCVYDYFLSKEIAQKFPLFEAIVKGKHIKQPPWNKTTIIKSQNGVPFQVFGKFKKFHADLYASWLAPYLQNSLYAETWQNDPEKLPSDCDLPYTVENVEEITFSDFDLVFKSSRDHSKVAVAKSSDAGSSFTPWVCIGDINRTKGQKKRGGGTVCLSSSVVWKAFHKSISKVDSCNSTNHV